MSIHIEFENGNNPYNRKNMNCNEFTAELEKWQKKYILKLKSMFGTIYSYVAKEKMNA